MQLGDPGMGRALSSFAMKDIREVPWCLLCLVLMLAADLGVGAAAAGRLEPSFETLTVGLETYTNVTVFQRKKDVVYLKHDGGLMGIRVVDLGLDARVALGYESAPAPKLSATATSATNLSPGLNLPPLNVEPSGPGAAMPPLRLKGLPNLPANITPEALMKLGMTIILIFLAVVLVMHILFSWLFRVICIKAGSEPGFMIWLPVLQIFPILQAAGMSKAWPFGLLGLSVFGGALVSVSPTVALLVSALSSLAGLVLWGVWSVRICIARGKHPALGILLLLPGVNLVMLVYLAASK
jgi:hypothetical protein